MIRKYFFNLIIINCLTLITFAQSSKNIHPYSNDLLLTLGVGPNYALTDYENSNFGLSFVGGLEYYLPTSNRNVFGFKLNLSQENISGDKNFLGLPNTYNTDFTSAGLGIIYSHSFTNVFCPFVSIGAAYDWYTFQTDGVKSIYFNYSNGGEKNSLVYTVNGGFRFNVSNGIGISADIGYNYIANDNLDAIKIGEFEDFYLCANIGIIINLFNEDIDSDGDGIVDSKDLCPSEAEDIDGFHDEDGCPDNDNDGDGIKDDNDLCPNIKEDFDGFKDEDGCPDEDNDNDGIKDADDLCQNNKEDFDGFQDEDGCPDIDNDNDGILDADDKCPNAPETFNGYQDEDGCPDEAPKPVIIEKEKQPEVIEKPKKVKEEKKESVDLTNVPSIFSLQGESTFSANNLQIKSSANSRLNEIAEQMKKYPSVKWRIEVHIDKQNSAVEASSITRQQASAILSYLISRGVSSENLQAVGLGDSSPVSNNNTVYGRMKNKRVIIKRLSN
ncbi:MAG: OmpA family protein [Ignavibacteriales bacterium]|nr:OmpA family protein [Ignavibacteriales bacterium]